MISLCPMRVVHRRGFAPKSGKLAFVDAERSVFLWAQHYGYKGEQLSQPSESSEEMNIYSYLDGVVIHYKMNTRAHNAGGGLTEAMLLKFLDQSNQPDAVKWHRTHTRSDSSMGARQRPGLRDQTVRNDSAPPVILL